MAHVNILITGGPSELLVTQLFPLLQMPTRFGSSRVVNWGIRCVSGPQGVACHRGLLF
jgi:hypothetical protein